MSRDGYMSGSELRQYLRISTRKLKYLMDHDYIPHENTGHKTHKYLVKIHDAEVFKLRMEHEPGFLAELNGLFSSRPSGKSRQPLLAPTEENCAAFAKWLSREWREYPDALQVKLAAELCGERTQYIRRLIQNGKLHGVKIGAVQYLSKEGFICYLASPESLASCRAEEYANLIRAFKRRQCRERENEKRKEKRREEKQKN